MYSKEEIAHKQDNRLKPQFGDLNMSKAFLGRIVDMDLTIQEEERGVWKKLIEDGYVDEAEKLLLDEVNSLLNGLSPSKFNEKIRKIIDKDRELAPLLILIPDDLSSMDKTVIKNAMGMRELSEEEVKMWRQLFEKGLAFVAAGEILRSNFSQDKGDGQLSPDELLELIMWHQSNGGILPNSNGNLTTIAPLSRKRREINDSSEKFQPFEMDIPYSRLNDKSDEIASVLKSFIDNFFISHNVSESPLHKLSLDVENNLEKTDEVVILVTMEIDSRILPSLNPFRKKTSPIKMSFTLTNDESSFAGVSLTLELEGVLKIFLSKTIDLLNSQIKNDSSFNYNDIVENLPDLLSGGLISFKLKKDDLGILGHIPKDFNEADMNALTYKMLSEISKKL